MAHLIWYSSKVPEFSGSFSAIKSLYENTTNLGEVHVIRDHFLKEHA